MPRSFHKSGLYLAVLLILFGCEFRVPERPRIITVSNAPAFRPVKPEDVNTEEQAIWAIMTACKGISALPITDPLHVHLYKNTASLAFYGHGWSTLPIDVDNQSASAQPNKILVNLEATPKKPFGLIRVLAHEYGHTIEYSLAGQKLVTPNWFSEGFADWITAKILDALRWQDYSITVQGAREELLAYKNNVPKISYFMWDQNWVSERGKPKGLIRTYRLAFVAVNVLIEKKGLPAVMGYIRTGKFESSFGVSLNNFSTEVEQYLADTPRPRLTQFRIAQPNWRVGDQWTYLEQRFGRKIILRKKFTKEELFNGVLAVVVEINGGEILYDKETLGAVAAVKNGKLVASTNTRPQELLWPLESRKEWQNSFTVRDLLHNSNETVEQLMVVTGEEEIKVPGGSFEAVKIEAFGTKSGNLLAEYWYSPTVKWFVKSRTYDYEDGIKEQELLSFKVD